MNANLMRITSRLLIASVLSLAVPFQSASAKIMGTDMVNVSVQSQSTQSQDDRARIRAFLEREDVVQQMQAQGIDANIAKARVDVLTDQEVQKVAGNLDSLPAGGDILGVLLTVFIVLLITDILGFTKVFSFTRSAR